MPDTINALADQKRELVIRSERYRQSLEANCSDVREAVAWIPRTVRLLRSVYPVVLLVMPLIGFAVRKRGLLRKRPPPKKGLLGKAAVGIKAFRTVKPFWDGFREAQRSHKASSKRRF